MKLQVRIEVCGRLSVKVGGRDRTPTLPGRKGRLALIYLALQRDRPVSRDELADAIWGERAPRSVRSSLNSLLSKLRHALGPGVVEGTSSLQLAAGVSVDLDEARLGLEEAQARLGAGDYERARTHAYRDRRGGAPRPRHRP